MVYLVKSLAISVNRMAFRTVLMLVATIGGFMSGLLWPAVPAFAQSCTPSPFKLVVEKGMSSGSFYGNSSSIRVMAAVTNYLWVNSIYVDKDSANLIEVGWSEHPTQGNEAFSVRLINGVYYDSGNLQTLFSNTDHTFRSVSRTVPGGYEWAILIDGVERWAWSHTYSAGSKVRAVQERDSTCDDSTSHFWLLKYANSSRVFLSWTNMDYSNDNDSEYRACVVSNVEFWVKTVC